MLSQEMIKGLEILNKYIKDGQDSFIEAQHDVVFYDPRITKKDVSEEDVVKLTKLGWHTDGCDLWCHYT